jgi:hypothetical protein
MNLELKIMMTQVVIKKGNPQVLAIYDCLQRDRGIHSALKANPIYAFQFI